MILRPFISPLRLELRILCIFLCSLIVVQQQVYAVDSNSSNMGANSFEAYQAADILQIRPEVDRLLRLQQEAGQQVSANEEILSLRAFILRKIFQGTIDVRRACSKVGIETAYTYGILQREQRRQGRINEFFNILNFTQLATLYTIEPYLRISEIFKPSAILTCVGAGLSSGLPTINILYNKFSRAKGLTPPKFLVNVLEAGPVDGSGMPQTIERYLNSPSADGKESRREAMFALWKKHYGVDASKKGSLCSLNDGGGKSLGLLNTRIVLLWSLYNFIEGFDQELFALLTMVQTPSPPPVSADKNSFASMKLKPGAREAARLLKIQPVVEELILLNKENVDNNHRIELEVYLQERVLAGVLEMGIATNKIDGELNYAYHIALSQLLTRRGKGLQLNYETNFIQTGVFGAIAGLLYLKGHAAAGNEMFIIQSSIGLALTSLALCQIRGGSRKIDTPANSLAQFFNPDPKQDFHFSRVVSDFLDSPSPESKTGKSRRDFILERWKEGHVTNFNLKSKTKQEKLAAMSPSKRDTITIVHNRVALLHSLKARLEEFDSELFDLLEATEPAVSTYNGASDEATMQKLEPPARGMIKLLGIQFQVGHLIASLNDGTTQASRINLLKQQSLITRRILLAFLDARKAVSQLDVQIATETTARDRIIKMRDLAINLTNNANFFQLGVLGLITDGPLALSSDPKLNLYGNRLNIVSGYLVAGLTGATIFEQAGGLRLTKAEPNMIGSAFGLKSPENCQLSPTISKFLESVPTTSVDGLTRKEELVAYWKKSKVISVNVKRAATLEKLAANGPSHHFWSETIGLITNRIRMLYDIKAVIDLMNVGLSETLRAID